MTTPTQWLMVSIGGPLLGHHLFIRMPGRRLSKRAGVPEVALLMFGLTAMPASGASFLLNAEAVFTALLAWFAFRENFDRRVALGIVVIVAGVAILSWPGEARFARRSWCVGVAMVG